MKFKNIYTFGIIIGITTILLSGTYFLLNLNKEIPVINKSNNSHKDDSIENSSVYYNDVNTTESLKTFNLSFDKIPHNTKPTFKVGEKFEYSSYNPIITSEGIDNSQTSNQKTIYSVIKKEIYKGKECYVIEGTTLTIITNKTKSFIIPNSAVTHLFYIDTETGRGIYYTSIPFKDEMNKTTKEFKRFFGEIPSEISEIWEVLPACFVPWMLSLNNEFKIKIKNNKIGSKKEIRVIGKEVIKNRECYKVEVRSIDENNKVQDISIKWIDVKKRIIVKEEKYWEQLKVAESNLVSELK